LPDWDEKAFIWLQFWLNAAKVGAIEFEFDHAWFILCKTWQIDCLTVFNNIRVLMSIHVNPLLKSLLSLTKLHKPLMGSAYAEGFFHGDIERWEDGFIEAFGKELSSHRANLLSN
jgi:hypothetical protein